MTHGSLYPWKFETSTSVARGWYRLWHQSSWWTSNGDVLGNVLLFIPVGALSALLLQPAISRPAGRVLTVLLLGSLFAFVLQVLQIWLPRRSPAFSDVVWNAVGLLLGMPLAAHLQSPLQGLQSLWRRPYRTGLGMAALWLCISWWPLLPLLSGYQLRLTLRELGSVAHIHWLAALPPAVGVAVVLHLMREARWRALMVVALPLAALVGQFVFVYPVPRPPLILAWLAGVVAGALSWLWSARLADRAFVCAVALTAGLAAVTPWQWSPFGGTFNLVPLDAVWSAPQRTPHSLALMWDLFWVATVFILGRHLDWKSSHMALALTLLLLGRELLQRGMPLQQADITPVLLPLLVWLLVRHRQARGA